MSRAPAGAGPRAFYSDVLDASRIIGMVHEFNAWASDEIVERLLALGKPVALLTMGEVLDVIEQHRTDVRKRYRAVSAGLDFGGAAKGAGS